jgi:hypothetical protein
VPEARSKLKAESWGREWALPYPPPPGNADGCERKGVAGKAIRNSMKTKGEQKTKAGDNTETQSALSVAEVRRPRVSSKKTHAHPGILKKRLQVIENKGLALK